MHLDRYDIAFLKLLNGEEQDLFHEWGAAMGLTLEKTRRLKLVEPNYKPSGDIEYRLSSLGKETLEEYK